MRMHPTPITLLFIVLAWGAISPAQTPPDSPEFMAAYRSAADLFTQNKYDEAMKKLEEAQALNDRSAQLWNLRGAIETRRQRYPEGRAAFEKALALDPQLTLAIFNLGEIAFLDKDYDRSLSHFREYLKKDPQNDLAKFKVFLNELLKGNTAQVQETLKKSKPSPDSPLHYMMLAAEQYAAQNRDGGLREVKSALGIYNPSQVVLFCDAFIQLGWLESSDIATSPVEGFVNSERSIHSPMLPTTSDLQNVLPSLDGKKKE